MSRGIDLKKPVKFSVQKNGEKNENNQDACGFNEKFNLFAISDGVSQSLFSNLWSKKLVNKFINNPFDMSNLTSDSLQDWLKDIREEWKSDLDGNDYDHLLVEIAKKEGSHATFAALRVINDKKIQIFAVGDSNIFCIRHNKLEYKFPLENASQFSDRTTVISSIHNIKNEYRYVQWHARSRDLIIMATDALAKWILESYKNGEKPWKKIFERQKDIENFIEELRKDGKIEDDDTTAILLQI